MIVYVQLKDIIIDPSKKIDLLSIPKDEAISLIKNSYGFLSSSIDVSMEGDNAVIKFTEEKAEKVNEALKLYQKGVREAEKGEYSKAIKTFEKVLEVVPQHIDARRNLAMAYLESGDAEKAEEYLRECLRLDPNDRWSNLLLGNIYARIKRNLDVAEFFYQKCYEIDPNDNFMLNNYAAVMLEKGKPDMAKELFEKALSIAPSYPNTYYGLALLYQNQNRPELVLEILERLFSQPKSKDIRSSTVYKMARDTYRQVCKDMAESKFDNLLETVLNRKKSIESEGGFPIQVVEDNSLEYISATVQMAWKHNREEHIVKYRKKMSAVTPHLIAHELEHIALEEEARRLGRNRYFATTAATREYAIRSVSGHIEKLQEWGYSDDGITNVILKLTSGLCNQLFNSPSDMMVEYRIFENMKELYPSQFVSLCQFQEEALQLLQNKDIKRNTPPPLVPVKYGAELRQCALCRPSL